MAIAYRASPTKWIAIDPGDARGPWTIETFPNPADGQWFGIASDTMDGEPVTVTIPNNNPAGGEPTFKGPTIDDGLRNIKVPIFGSSFMFSYVAADNTWRVPIAADMSPQRQALFGAPGSYSPGTSASAVTNWGDSKHTRFFNATPPNQTTGVLTAPEIGEYRLNFKLIHHQGNSNKELSILYWVMSSVAGNYVIDVFDVATDKTDYRTGGASFLMDCAAGEELRLGISREGGSIGTTSFEPSTFELEFIEGQDITGT